MNKYVVSPIYGNYNLFDDIAEMIFHDNVVYISYDRFLRMKPFIQCEGRYLIGYYPMIIPDDTYKYHYFYGNVTNHYTIFGKMYYEYHEINFIKSIPEFTVPLDCLSIYYDVTLMQETNTTPVKFLITELNNQEEMYLKLME